MTREEILNMPAGLEMDTLIADKVKGETKPAPHEHEDVLRAEWSGGRNWYCMPEYDKGDVCEWEPIEFSTEIQYAWEVVEYLEENKITVVLSLNNPPSDEIHKWNCEFFTFVEPFIDIDDVYAETAPLAICRAALLAVMETEANRDKENRGAA